MKVASVVVAFIFILQSSSTDAFLTQPNRARKNLNFKQNVGDHKRNNNIHHVGKGVPMMQLDSSITSADISGTMQSASLATSEIMSSPLFEYFLQTMISYAVPTFFTIVAIGFAAKAFRAEKSSDKDRLFMSQDSAVSELYSDLYGNGKSKNEMPEFLFGGPPGGKGKKSALMKNLGIPAREYIKITSLNEKFDAYDYSMKVATKSKAAAAAEFRSKSFDRALQLALGGSDVEKLPSYAKTRLLEAEKEFLSKGQPLVERIQYLESLLTREAIDKELESMGVEAFELDPEPLEGEKANKTVATNETALVKTSKKRDPPKSETLQEISKLQRELQQAELEFIQDLTYAVGPEKAYALRAAILGDVASRGSGGLLLQIQDRPLSSMLQRIGSEQKSLFVMRFPGDVTASQLDGLREEVTAVIRNAKPGDEALVVLQSGGGTVTGYGLAAGQLVRLKEKGLFLTIAVEQVAASGGYMMTCVADKIVASPFAVLGSIGVISEIPNVYERLKEEGIEFQTVTAGKFKRTLTPTKKVTPDDFAKAKEDVEMILTQFSGFVKKNRPMLDIESVATGETWFGEAALERGLCDEIRPVDDVLLKYVDDGYKVYEVEYSPPPELPNGLAGLFAGSPANDDNSIGRNVVRWMVRAVAEEMLSLDNLSVDETKKYMARDDTAGRTRL